jgi:hypothetical protein
MSEQNQSSTDEVVSGFCFNGINGATGEYYLPPLRARQLAAMAKNERIDSEELEELKRRWALMAEPHFAPIHPIDPDDLSEAGWGVIFAPEITELEKEALSPLLALRREQAGARFQDFDGKAYRPGDNNRSFLGRCDAGPGPVNPTKAPYYLLIVGSPESIPYRFQYLLDVQYAVGRLHFDRAEEYARYAQTVVAAERATFRHSRELAFFGVRNYADRATQMSADHLIAPLSQHFAREDPSWMIKVWLAEEATRANLSGLLGGSQTPALLLSASHGIGFPMEDPRQLRHQGALLCQDWPGPFRHRGPINEDFYFAGDHLASSADLRGMIAFFFACFGAGTPKMDDFAHLLGGPQKGLAPHAFVAGLPKHLLGHPNGALAVIGHVERAWSCSFLWERTGAQLAAFQSAISALLSGKRIGFAMEPFNIRYAELAAVLTSELEDQKYRWPRPEIETLSEDETLAGLWTAHNDARSYVVLGDPAVRLAVSSDANLSPGKENSMSGRRITA